LIYLDTSILVAYYCPEALSEQAEQILRTQIRPALSELVEVELFSSVARKVREGGLSSVDAKRLMTQFLTHVQDGFYTRISVEPLHFDKARDWISILETPLRTLDALHLAIADSKKLRLVTADKTLANAANTFEVDVQFLALP
jgi:predicted nucleic acid-binding protein